MSLIELTHRIKEKAATARYVALTPEYPQWLLEKELAELEELAQQLIDIRENEE